MRKTKRTAALLSVLLLIGTLSETANAECATYHWYCAHVKDHARPQIASELAFTESCGGYFLDRQNKDPNAATKVIYLPFDAGYENGNVEKILDVLQREQVTGAFFILGHLIDANPELVKRMVSDGHIVANHTVRHRNMSQATEAQLMEEIHALENAYFQLTGQEMRKYYRPPEGCFSRENLETLFKNGYKTIFWSFAYPDWDNEKQMSAQRAKSIIMDNLHNGEVMLLHPTSRVNAEILGVVIREAKAQGYRFGTLDELTGGGGNEA